MDEVNWKRVCSVSRRKGNNLIQSFLDAGLDVNALNKNGDTMLSLAAESGDLGIVKFLLRKGADGNVTNNDGTKPLHVAAGYGHKAIVKFFVNLGICADSCDDDNWTPLHYVAVNNPLETARGKCQKLVQVLVDGGADLDAVNWEGCTPLLTAAQNSNMEVAELFINLGANVDCCDKNKWTVFHHCCRNGWLGIARILLGRRFDIDLNAKTLEGYTPLIIAADSSHKDIIHLLIESGTNLKFTDFEDQIVLRDACRRGLFKKVKSLINRGCDLNAKDSRGGTPLLVAAENAHFNIVLYLIDLGADVKCCCHGGYTVLHHACREGRLDIVKCLVNMGCDLNAKTTCGKTPLFSAVDHFYFNIVEYLIDSGVDVAYSCDDDGFTVLHYACRKGWLNVVKSLIKKGSDLNVQGKHLNTALHVAIEYHQLDIVEHLLEAGADCNMENHWGLTAFHVLLVSNHCLRNIRIFMESGAYFRSIDYDTVMKDRTLRKALLRNPQLCSQSVINKFNDVDLPKIYKITGISDILPPIAKMRIVNSTNVAWDLTETITYEIRGKGYCNVLNVRPLPLNISCVGSLVEHYGI